MRVQASQNLRFSGYKNVISKCFLEPLDSLAKGQGMKGGALPAYWAFCTDAGGLVSVSSGAGFALL